MASLEWPGMTPVPRPAIPRRQLALFLLSIVVPCVVLVGLGIRIILQQEELADKHATDERRLERLGTGDKADLVAFLRVLTGTPSTSRDY